MKKEYLPFIAAAFASIVLYLLWAICYGFVPYYWDDTVKATFITVEIFGPTLMFLMCVAILNKDG